MDTDSSSLPSALVFAVSLLLFSYLSLTERSVTNGSNRLSGNPRWLRLAFSPLKYACVIAVTLSGLVLALSVWDLGWGPISFLALGLLVALAAIDQAMLYFVAKGPVASRRWSSPLLSLISAGSDKSLNNGANNPLSNGSSNGNPNGDSSRETESLLITPEELVGLDNRDREMLRSILRLDVSTVREVMVHRLDMIVVEVNATLAEAASLMGQNGHSRLPVYDEHTDNIVGVVHSRDLLTLFAREQAGTPLREAMRPAYFIPETKHLDDLLAEMQGKGVQIAIVVDEYGGTEGLVTMEDLLEEIVGEIEDEFSRSDEPEVVHLPNGSALVAAGVTTEDVEELFDTRLADSSDVDTLGGYIYRSLGRIPQTGDTVVTDHLRIEVVSTLGRRLRRLRIDRIAEEAASRTGAKD